MIKMDNKQVDNLKENETESFLVDEDDTHSDVKIESRDTWSNRMEFLLALIGYTVGIGSIWRFPILCVRNGGGAFLIPFCLNVAFVVGPIYYLEINLGQFTGNSPVSAYEYCPLVKGLGYLSFIMTLLAQYYFMTIMTWILYYLYSSFSSVLPWTTCNNSWNTPDCFSISEALKEKSTTFNITTNTTQIPTKIALNTSGTTSSTSEFWNNNVLKRSGGLEDMGSIQLHLAVALFVAWVLTVLGIIKGTKSLGKVVYFTVLFPYVLLTILLVRGLTLEGSMDGIMYLLKFDVDKLAKVQVWLDASVQVFYSMGPIWGAVISLSSRNKYHQPALMNTVIVCVAEIFTAVFASFVLFSVIGFMAREIGVPVEELAKASGVGLAFLAYPTAVSLMPFPQFWSVSFFLMMVLVMLDTVFGVVEIILYCLEDMIPVRWKFKTLSLKLGFAVFMFFIGLVFVTEGGIYLFQLFDWYIAIFGLFVGATIEVLSISLVYGIDRFSEDISTMSGKTMSVLGRILFCIVIPIITFLSQYSEPNYGDEYQYKRYAIVIGFNIGLVPVIAVILPAIFALFQITSILMSSQYSEPNYGDRYCIVIGFNIGLAPVIAVLIADIFALFQITFILMLSQYSEPNYGDGYQYKPLRYAIVIWLNIGLAPGIAVIIPAIFALFQITFILMLSQYSEPNYGDGYQYKRYAIVIGFNIGLAPVIAVIIPALYVLYKQKGSLMTRLKRSLEPSTKWLSRDDEVRETNKRCPYTYESTIFRRLRVNVLGNKDTPML